MSNRLGRPRSDEDMEAPSVPPGSVLSLGASDWLYGRGQEAGTRLIIVVSRVRTDLAPYYNGESVWVEGHAPDCGGQHSPCRQALVRTAALPRR